VFGCVRVCVCMCVPVHACLGACMCLCLGACLKCVHVGGLMCVGACMRVCLCECVLVVSRIRKLHEISRPNDKEHRLQVASATLRLMPKAV